MANGNQVMTVETHDCCKQNDCYYHNHVYNKINLLR